MSACGQRLAFCTIAVFAAVSAFSLGATGFSEGPRTTRVDVDSNGGAPEFQGHGAAMSANGRLIVFISAAPDLVAGDTNDAEDAFVRDRVTGTTTRVSVASNGTQGNRDSDAASISSDGRYVVLHSYASNLVRGDHNGPDAFLFDRRTRTTVRVSVGTRRQELSGAFDPAISANGRFVAFVSALTVRRPGGGKRVIDPVYVHDRKLRRTVIVSRNGVVGDTPSLSGDGRYVLFAVERQGEMLRDRSRLIVVDRNTRVRVRVDINSRGRPANDWSPDAYLSANGRFVVFRSYASNLVRNDYNGGSDIFVRDLRRGTTRRVSIRPNGSPLQNCIQLPEDDGDGEFSLRLFDCATSPRIAAGGRFVAFGTRQSAFDRESPTGGVYVRDLKRHVTLRVARDADIGSVSGDGRFVSFRRRDGSGLYVRGPLR
jgi:Tol biopolymer transport system component